MPDALPGWTHVYSGKVRDLYLPEPGSPAQAEHGDVVLVVASDRISAYDFVLPSVIPDKGRVLTQLTLWWFEQLGDVVGNHLVTAEAGAAGVPDAVAGRGMVCRRLEMFPVECVVRGYLTGSGLAEYRQVGSVCGIPLPDGLTDGSRLPEAIFTPTTKAPVGEHDEAVSFEGVVESVGAQDAAALRDLTLAAYARAEELARERGIILADTKLEFGRATDGPFVGQILLGDEIFTPDSSRFWPADTWAPGGAQPSFDKQYVRDWLTSPASGWDRKGELPPPELPADVVERTRERYLEAYRQLTGRELPA